MISSNSQLSIGNARPPSQERPTKSVPFIAEDEIAPILRHCLGKPPNHLGLGTRSKNSFLPLPQSPGDHLNRISLPARRTNPAHRQNCESNHLQLGSVRLPAWFRSSQRMVHLVNLQAQRILHNF